MFESKKYEASEASGIPKKMWTPPADSGKNMRKFMDFVERRHPELVSFDDKISNAEAYDILWHFSVDHAGVFWRDCWDFFGFKSSKEPTAALIPGPPKTFFTEAKFFPGARLNFAENLLKFRDDKEAIVFLGEHSPRKPVKWTYRELYDEVSQVAGALRGRQVKPSDRVVGFIPNTPYSIIAMLGATAIGATWSSCSPDFGIQGVMDRFGQIAPVVLFTTTHYYFKGKLICLIPKIRELAKKIPSLKHIIFTPFNEESDEKKASEISGSEFYSDFLEGYPATESIKFEQLPFNHPVYIMYSSGTTGLPKCIVQGPGVLLNHMKEHVLHLDQTREDRIFYYTTTGWMMWNWLVSALAVGSTIVIWEGNPCYPKMDSLWQFAEDQKLTVFGTSAKYLQVVMDAKVRPGTDFDLSNLKVICSTGSPASDVVFDYVYTEIKNLQFASISGGTDINGCFALGCPLLAVHSTELQARGLGMNVMVYDENAEHQTDTRGELVCLTPMPSQPLFFWNDSSGERFKRAYFDFYQVGDGPGQVKHQIWRHGDFVKLSSATGGMVVYGRSDATLNPGGVRIGTSDIYRVVEETLTEVEDSVVVGVAHNDDVIIVLFVQMKSGAALDEDLKKLIRTKIRYSCSPRHMPKLILECPGVPYTISGKKVELAVKACVEGKPVRTNESALRNPETLKFFKEVKLTLE